MIPIDKIIKDGANAKAPNTRKRPGSTRASRFSLAVRRPKLYLFFVDFSLAESLVFDSLSTNVL